ncbi:MAG: hypothetical protein IJP39_03110 [Bacteroidales bacterium]|nr:hypothetical protein [Bacteroidales bacterium]
MSSGLIHSCRVRAVHRVPAGVPPAAQRPPGLAYENEQEGPHYGGRRAWAKGIEPAQDDYRRGTGGAGWYGISERQEQTLETQVDDAEMQPR